MHAFGRRVLSVLAVFLIVPALLTPAFAEEAKEDNGIVVDETDNSEEDNPFDTVTNDTEDESVKDLSYGVSSENYPTAEVIKNYGALVEKLSESVNNVNNTNYILASDVVAYAMQFEGYPYDSAYGPNAFDCCGLVKYVFAHFGVDLPWSTGPFWTSPEDYGTVVSEENAKPGDVISWDGHMGIYIGDGKCINALNPESGVCVITVSSFTNKNGVNPPHHYIRIYGVTDDITAPEVSHGLITAINDTNFKITYHATDNKGVKSVYATVAEYGKPANENDKHSGTIDENGNATIIIDLSKYDESVRLFSVSWYAEDEAGNVGGEKQSQDYISLYEAQGKKYGVYKVGEQSFPVRCAPFEKVNGKDTTTGRLTDGDKVSVMGVYKNTYDHDWYLIGENPSKKRHVVFGILLNKSSKIRISSI